MKGLLQLAMLFTSLGCLGANLTGTISYSGSQTGAIHITASQAISGNKVLKLSGAGTVRVDALTNLAGPEITVQFWFKGANPQSAVRQQSGGLYIIASYNGGHLTTPDGFLANGAAGITDGNWHHVVMTRKRNGTFAGYVDGQLAASKPVGDTDLPNVQNPVYFGSVQDLGEYATGEMDEIAIWNRALSAAEIAANAGSTLPTNAPGLLGYWKFDDDTYNDSSTNGYTATPSGDALIVSDDIPIYNQTILSDAPGAYTITNLPLGNGFSVTAFLDANGDSIKQTAEPSGAYAGNPFSLAGNLAGVDLTLTEPPYITQQPQPPPGNRAPVGGNASFSVTAFGTPTLAYQWYRDSVPLVNGSHISGATSTNLQINNLTALDAGGYACVITNAQGAIASKAPQLEVITSPLSISGQFQYSGGQTGQVRTSVSRYRTNKVLNLSGASHQYADTTLTDLSGDALSIEFWFRGSTISSAVRQQGGAGYISAGWGANLYIMSNDGGTAGLKMSEPSTLVVDGNWHHVAMTWQRNTVNGFISYLDGEVVAQRTSQNNAIPFINDAVRFGSLQGVAEFCDGQLDEIAIWGRALTRSEIRAHARDGLTGSETGLTGYWNFDDGTGVDLSPNGNNAELRNGASIVDVAIPGQGGVYPDVFAGIGAYTINSIPAGSNYVLSAFLDSNGNGALDLGEARGAYAGNPFNLAANLANANIVLYDPTVAIALSGTQITVQYNVGTLEWADVLTGPWSTVPGATPPAFSTNTFAPMMFFRAR